MDGPTSGPANGLTRLRDAADDGRLDELCDRHGIAVLSVFGSAARAEPAARDLDVAVLHRPGWHVEYLPLIGELQRLTGTEIDLAVLDKAGPVLRERALVGAVALYEYRDGEWARAATAATLDRMDTAWVRRLDLDLLAG